MRRRWAHAYPPPHTHTHTGYDATAHTEIQQLPFQWGADFHRYKVVWAPTSITFFVDGKETFSVSGTTKTIPYTAGYSALILRPKDTTYISDVAYSAAWMSYDPAY